MEKCQVATLEVSNIFKPMLIRFNSPFVGQKKLGGANRQNIIHTYTYSVNGVEPHSILSAPKIIPLGQLRRPELNRHVTDTTHDTQFIHIVSRPSVPST